MIISIAYSSNVADQIPSRGCSSSGNSSNGPGGHASCLIHHVVLSIGAAPVSCLCNTQSRYYLQPGNSLLVFALCMCPRRRTVKFVLS